jgi:hypothetical protein
MRSRLSAASGGIDALTARVSVLERYTGLTADLADLDDELARLRRDKESAIDAQEFRLAEALSDAESDLLIDRDRRAREWTQRPSLAAEVAQLRAEVEHLRAVLHSHGLDEDDAG